VSPSHQEQSFTETKRNTCSQVRAVGDRYPSGPLEGERPLHGATDQLPPRVVLSWAGQKPQVKWPTQEGSGLMPRSSVGLRAISKNYLFSPRPVLSNVGIDRDGVGGFSLR
jgi:hypothetical protein